MTSVIARPPTLPAFTCCDIHSVLDKMTMNLMDLAIQERGFLFFLDKHCPLTIMREMGGVNVITRTMLLHQQVVSLQEMGLEILSRFNCICDTFPVFGEAEATILAMTHFPDNNHIQLKGLTILETLARSSKKDRKTIYELGGTGLVLKFMRHTLLNADIYGSRSNIKSGLRALKSLGCNEEGLKSLVQSGVIPVMVDIIVKYHDEDFMYSSAWEILNHIAKEPEFHLDLHRYNCFQLEFKCQPQMTITYANVGDKNPLAKYLFKFAAETSETTETVENMD